MEFVIRSLPLQLVWVRWRGDGFRISEAAPLSIRFRHARIGTSASDAVASESMMSPSGCVRKFHHCHCWRLSRRPANDSIRGTRSNPRYPQ
jgi:hypothetical protein